jgi:Flavin containing amine oxidoreductase
MEPYVVVGGGLAGLTAANALADAGHKVTLFEQSERLGGRAITTEQRGFLMNLGPHALYRGGIAMQTLRDWKIPIAGKTPDLRGGGAYLVNGGEKYPFFVNFSGLVTHQWFSVREKIELMRVMRLFTVKQQPKESSMAKWIQNHARSERVMAYLRAVVRVATYAADPKNLSAARALEQIRSAFTQGVLYLDGGWQTLVDGLAARARSKGMEIRTEQVDSAETGERTILAVPPAEVERITGSAFPKLRPSRMACLTLGLRRLPGRLDQSPARFALGIDQPIYLSVHSHWAKLAGDGAALVHVGKYLSADGDGAKDRAELEAFADLAIPGWRDYAEVVQFLPNMVVTHGLASCEGRPGVDALPNVRIAGDWVGDEGMLADSAVASGLRAARSMRASRAHAA